LGEELDMNFFFLNEDMKDVERNLDRQLSIAKSVADKLKIKYDDILQPKSTNTSSVEQKSPGLGSVNQEPSVEEVIQKTFHHKIN